MFKHLLNKLSKPKTKMFVAFVLLTLTYEESRSVGTNVHVHIGFSCKQHSIAVKCCFCSNRVRFVNLQVLFNVGWCCKQRSTCVYLHGNTLKFTFEIFVSPIFSHPFKIIVSLLINSFQVQICSNKKMILLLKKQLIIFIFSHERIFK